MMDCFMIIYRHISHRNSRHRLQVKAPHKEISPGNFQPEQCFSPANDDGYEELANLALIP